VDVESTKRKQNISPLICMDEIKFKSSTICGHIFCQDCICNVIHAQNKCPIFWEKHNLKHVHHVYQFNIDFVFVFV
jgi:hypothetical protein